MKNVFIQIDTTTYVLTGLIIVVAIICCFYIWYQKEQGTLVAKRRWIEQIPSFVSTLGVLGTFLGITFSLLDFNSMNLEASIPNLLDGLKTAFFTSLAGMIGSLVLTRVVSSYYDQQDEGVSDINLAAGEIVKAVKAMSETNQETLRELKQQAIVQANNQSAFYVTCGNVLNVMKDSINASENNIQSLVLQVQTQTTNLSEIKERTKSLILQIQDQANSLSEIKEYTNGVLRVVGTIELHEREQADSLEVVQNSINATAPHISKMASDMGEMVETTSAIANIEEEVSVEVKKLGDKLHTEVLEIEDKMKETNKLLEEKFNEFSELLKKSNTEALVEVMKKVTQEFQKQMNALINKLIQENFDQLNKSVEKLNIWQQENKEMISSLTKQYKQMADNFDGTSVVLQKVGTDTRALVSDGGKLDQLVKSLSQVLIEDKKFVEVTKKLSETVDLTKNNMEQFDESTKSLNEWVRKQRNFVDGVQMLIQKLDELNKIRNYNEEFWKDTKKKLEEGVGFISKGSQDLNRQLTNLDQQFYARLSATLAELDTCIQAMVKGNKN